MRPPFSAPAHAAAVPGADGAATRDASPGGLPSRAKAGNGRLQPAAVALPPEPESYRLALAAPGPAPRRSGFVGIHAALLRRALPVLRARHPGRAAAGGDRRLCRRPDRRNAQHRRAHRRAARRVAAASGRRQCQRAGRGAAGAAGACAARGLAAAGRCRDVDRMRPAPRRLDADAVAAQPGLQPRQLRCARPGPARPAGHRPAPVGGVDRRRLRAGPRLRHGRHQPRAVDRPAASVCGQLARHAAPRGGDGAGPHHAGLLPSPAAAGAGAVRHRCRCPARRRRVPRAAGADGRSAARCRLLLDRCRPVRARNR